MRRVAAGGGVFQSKDGTKVHLPGSNLNDIANQADDLLEVGYSKMHSLCFFDLFVICLVMFVYFLLLSIAFNGLNFSCQQGYERPNSLYPAFCSDSEE